MQDGSPKGPVQDITPLVESPFAEPSLSADGTREPRLFP